MSSSNGYSWNAQSVLEQLIQRRGQTKVVFMNGLWTPFGANPTEGFQSQWRAVERTFSLIDYSQANQTSAILPNFNSSLDFQPIYNPSKGNDIDEEPRWFSTFTDTLAEHLFKPAIEEYERRGLNTRDRTYRRVRELANDPYHWLTNLPKVFTQGNDFRDRIGTFLQEYGNLEVFKQKINGDFPNFDPNSDLVEAFAQFFTDEAAPVSDKVNEQPWATEGWQQPAWRPESVNWLEDNPNNSLILIGHSQGNFFLEDGLMHEEFAGVDSSRIRVIALGSPTNYSSLQQNGSLPSGAIANFRNNSDAITDLQFATGISDGEKISLALEALNWRNLDGLLLNGRHDLYGNDDAYLQRSDVTSTFTEFFSQLHPQGYYFPNGPIVSARGQGTTQGDWLEDYLTDGRLYGYSGNDVLRGNGGNDTLISGTGWDFLDGGHDDVGEDRDRAEYLGWNYGITVHTESMVRGSLPYSDIYRVVKGSVDRNGQIEEDILVDIEEISGTDLADTMYGGRGSDRFFGQAGNDWLIGAAGDDIINGGEGNDIIDAGEGNNILDGGAGNDEFILTPGLGASIINNFEIGNDLLSLATGLTFEQLSITQGSADNGISTEIGVAGSNDLLATLSLIPAQLVTSSVFATV
ncbi:MAG: calcium-binding protein [Coleofasciculaceae cyanobacterium]